MVQLLKEGDLPESGLRDSLLAVLDPDLLNGHPPSGDLVVRPVNYPVGS